VNKERIEEYLPLIKNALEHRPATFRQLFRLFPTLSQTELQRIIRTLNPARKGLVYHL
jgi:hypothetical protein